MSLQETDQAAVAVATAPRVTLADMEAKIAGVAYLTGGTLDFAQEGEPLSPTQWSSIEGLTICVLVTTTGFTIIGKSAPASPENYDKELGEKFSYEDAMRQLWPFEGYLLRAKLAEKESQNG
jgi:hypothetical protein